MNGQEGDTTKSPPVEHLILLVEDNIDMLNIIQRALDRKGYGTATALNGAEALEILRNRKPQLILLDMKMPVMDGWEFARNFREIYGRSIPIVVMTAAEDSKLRADEIGADAYIGKPFELHELYEVVEDTVLNSDGGTEAP